MAKHNVHQVEEHEKKAKTLSESAHVAELSVGLLHRLHIGTIGFLRLLEAWIPPLRLLMVGITSIFTALNAVYFSKRSSAHKTAQVVIAVISTLTVVLGLIIPHATLATLVVYAAVELARECSHFFEIFKDTIRLYRVRHAIDKQKLRYCLRDLGDKAMQIGFGILAVVGAVMMLFSTAMLFTTPLPTIGLVCLIASGVTPIAIKASLGLAKRCCRSYRKVASVGERAATDSIPLKMISRKHPVHESTTDVYTNLNLLKEEANQQQKLRESGWVKQPVMTAEAQHQREAFWADHRYSNAQGRMHNTAAYRLDQISPPLALDPHDDDSAGDGNSEHPQA